MTQDADDSLLERYRNGEASDEEIRALEERLEAVPELRRKLVLDVLQDLSLYRVCGESMPSSESKENGSLEERGLTKEPALGRTELQRIISENAKAAAGMPPDEKSSHLYVQELMQRYVAGQLDPLESEALQILLRCDNLSAEEFQRICAREAQPHPVNAQGPSQTEGAAAVQDRSRRKSSSRISRERRLAAESPSLEKRRPLRRSFWALAAACALALTTGLIWNAVSSRPPAPDVAGAVAEDSRHRKEVLQRIEELDREAKALAAAQRAAAEQGRPVPAPPEAPQPNEDAFPQTLLTPTEELAQRTKDAEECARLLEQQRLLLLSELDSTRKAKRPAESEEESDDATGSARTAMAISAPAPAEAGRVVYVEGETVQAVLVRALEGSAHRTNLTTGTKLMSGDRIEVERGGGESAASLELQGGATIDLAAKTTLQVVDRNAVRLETGQIYACVNRHVASDKDVEYTTSFSLQTPAGRYLMEEARVEILASPVASARARTTARVDSGQVHVVNGKGHVLGRKGQEVSASANAAPDRKDGFRAPIWRGRNLTHPGLPLGKGNPVLFSNEDPLRNFCVEYALALAHTGEIDLRGVQVTHVAIDAQGKQKPDQLTIWRDVAQEIAGLRQTGLRTTPQPVLGAMRSLQRPASGRCEDTVPEPSPAVDQLLIEARRATPELPLVVVASGCLTDLASAWLLDHGMAKQTVVVTRTLPLTWNMDAWASVIVLEKFPCVICNVPFPANRVQRARLAGTRWNFLSARAIEGETDFSQFVCMTVPGFVQSSERARFVRGASGNPSDFRFEPDPNGMTRLTKRTDDQLMVREFEATFMAGSGAP